MVVVVVVVVEGGEEGNVGRGREAGTDNNSFSPPYYIPRVSAGSLVSSSYSLACRWHFHWAAVAESAVPVPA